MGRPMFPVRPITADRWIRERRPALDRPFRILLLFAVLQALLPQTQGKDITNLTSITQEVVNKNTSKSNTNSLQNEIALEDDGDDFYLGYSSYLRSNSSMLASNFTQENSLPTNNNDTNKAPKAGGHRRLKRAVTHLYNMILCATGCNPLAYKGYGCYCGFLGSGYPMDGIDRCCKMHDWCYDATDCPMFVEYFVPYYWKCYHGYKPICAIEHGEWGSSGSCAQRLCECDRSFAECLRRYRCPRHKAVCTSSPWRLIQNIFMII